MFADDQRPLCVCRCAAVRRFTTVRLSPPTSFLAHLDVQVVLEFVHQLHAPDLCFPDR